MQKTTNRWIALLLALLMVATLPLAAIATDSEGPVGPPAGEPTPPSEEVPTGQVITLNANGGTFAFADGATTHTVTLPADSTYAILFDAENLPVDSNFNFKFYAWYTTPGIGGTRVLAEYDVTEAESRTLFARWVTTVHGGALNGWVRIAGTEIGIGGAQVTVLDPLSYPYREVYSVRTNPQGHFTIPNQDFHSAYVIIVEATGYSTYRAYLGTQELSGNRRIVELERDPGDNGNGNEPGCDCDPCECGACDCAPCTCDENGNGPCDVCENDPCTCDENGNGPCDVCENDPCTCDENGNGPCDVCENDPCTCDENGNGNGNEPGCKCGADCKCSPGNCLCNNIVCTCPRQPTQGIDLLTRHAFLIGACCGNMLPGNAITRAEAATIFFRLMSDDQRTQHWYQENDFPDVSLEQWFNNAVSTTTAAGFFEGRPDGSFAPQTPITRAEFATVVVRMMGVSYQGPLRFPDIEGHWAEAAINAAAAEGWVVGMEDGMFRPDQSMTRAEAAAMINRKEGRVAPCEESKLPHMLRFPDNTNTEAWYYLYIKSATNSYQSMTDGRAYDYGYVSGLYEFWIRLLPHRDWTVLERPDSRPEDIFG